MNSYIYKYELLISDWQAVMLPEGSEILGVAMQSGKLCMWARVFPGKRIVGREIEIIGTGNPIPSDLMVRKFIGTVIDGSFVWHVFECR